jgi:hypothetical protein
VVPLKRHPVHIDDQASEGIVENTFFDLKICFGSGEAIEGGFEALVPPGEPVALKAVISLSLDSLPKVRRVARRTATGIVMIRKEGEMNRKSIRTSVRLPPRLTISSISLRILSIRRIMVKIISPMEKMGRISFRI